MLTVEEGIGEIASVAWGDLSDEEGWCRFALVRWDGASPRRTTPAVVGGTLGAGRAMAPVPPWEADDYRHVPDAFELFPDPEPLDDPPSRRKPRRQR